MDNFTNLNTILCKKKRNLNKEIDKYKIAKQNLKMENKKILKEEKNIIVQEKKREKEREKDEEEIKRKNEMIEKKYKIYIKAKISKLNILKNFMNNNCNIDKLLNNDFKKNRININEIKNSNISNSNEDKNKKKIVMFKKVAPKKNQNGERDINIIREEDENEKSILPFDMTKRISSFMDFSTILNDNSRIKESTNNRQKNVSRIIWGDVSAIEKNDDFL